MHSSSHSFHKMTQVQVILPCKLDQYGEASIIGRVIGIMCASASRNYPFLDNNPVDESFTLHMHVIHIQLLHKK